MHDKTIEIIDKFSSILQNIRLISKEIIKDISVYEALLELADCNDKQFFYIIPLNACEIRSNKNRLNCILTLNEVQQYIDLVERFK